MAELTPRAFLRHASERLNGCRVASDEPAKRVQCEPASSDAAPAELVRDATHRA